MDPFLAVRAFFPVGGALVGRFCVNFVRDTENTGGGEITAPGKELFDGWVLAELGPNVSRAGAPALYAQSIS